MKNYIDRYIYAVTKRLPETSREEVSKELRANIEDMLPKNPTDQDIDQVLHTLGSPRSLANNYKEQKRYVISPLYYDDYINVLKIVGIIFIAINVVFGTIDTIIEMSTTNVLLAILEIFTQIISRTISGFLSAFAIVTIIFWGIDYATQKSGKEEWKLNDLPDLPKPNTQKISKAETIVGLILTAIFGTLFILVLMNYLDYVGIYENLDTFITPMFSQDVANQFIPFFILSFAFSIIVSLFKLHYGVWRLNLAILHTSYEILSTSVFLLFLHHPNLIIPEAFQAIGDVFGQTAEQIEGHFQTGATGLTVLIVVLLGIDLISTWIKTMKSYKSVQSVHVSS